MKLRDVCAVLRKRSGDDNCELVNESLYCLFDRVGRVFLDINAEFK
jgi:hypothetical protein